MDLMKQCQLWNEKDEYQNIIDAIEALSQEERTPELDSELARAYNNLAGPENRELYEKAIGLLKPHEEYFKDDHNWNFRIAFAYYYLDQEVSALHYFNKALEARPGDEDTEQMIDACRECLAFPRFEKNFRQRTLDSWEAFTEGECELRRLLDLKDQDGAGEELVARCSELLKPAFENISFEMGFNGEKYELILTPEGDKARLFALNYFRRHAPSELLEKWNILVGRQPSSGFCLRAFGQNISASDIKVWTERKGGNKAALTLYCEILLPLLKEEKNKVWWLLSTLTDQVLGEIAAMALIDGFEVATRPKEEPAVSLDDLPKVLEDMGLELNPDAEAYLDNSYSAYQMEPDDNPDADWRLDVFAGSTRCPILVSQYLRGESDVMDDYHRDGVVAGFLTYPVDSFRGGEMGKELLDFRDSLEKAMLETAGEDAVTFLGGASGIYYGYLDLIAWDLPPVLNAAMAFFQNSEVEWANFHVFRRDVGALLLVDKSRDREDSPDASEPEGHPAPDAIFTATDKASENNPGHDYTSSTDLVNHLEQDYDSFTDSVNNLIQDFDSSADSVNNLEQVYDSFTDLVNNLIQDFDSSSDSVNDLLHDSSYLGTENGVPSEPVKALIKYLGCECQYFPPMKDASPIMNAFHSARQAGAQEGFVPMLIAADETLWECLIMNSDEDSDGEGNYSFNPDRVAQYRRKILAMPVRDGKAVLKEMLRIRKADAEYDDMDWDEEIIGDMKGGEPGDHFLSCRDFSGETLPLILARIPVKNPWEVFAYLPFGAWNDCPNTEELMAVAEYWFKQHGAVPAAMTHDELEFILPSPVSRERAMELATEQYAFCPDVVDQGSEDTSVGCLADSLRQSDMWYFWWD